MIYEFICICCVYLFQCTSKICMYKCVWKDVDLIVKMSVVVGEDDDLNEGFCQYSIVDDE